MDGISPYETDPRQIYRVCELNKELFILKQLVFTL